MAASPAVIDLINRSELSNFEKGKLIGECARNQNIISLIGFLADISSTPVQNLDIEILRGIIFKDGKESNIIFTRCF